MTVSIVWNDFIPSHHKLYSSKEGTWIVDQRTGRGYMNESRSAVSCKCFLLAIGTPVLHSAIGIYTIAPRVVRILSFYHFWKKLEQDKQCVNRCLDAKEDAIHIIGMPFGLVALEISALVGVFFPYNGRKLYASFERLEYGGAVLATCFQPGSNQHLLYMPVPGMNGVLL